MAAVLGFCLGSPSSATAQTPASDEKLQEVVDGLDDVRIVLEDYGLMKQQNDRKIHDMLFYCTIALAFILGLDALLPKPR